MRQICTVDGCGRIRDVAGLCNMHWRRFRRNGSTDPTPRILRRIAGSVELNRATTPEALEDGPCWEWSGRRTRHGYGIGPHPTNEPSRAVHRQAYTLAFGSIPAGLFVCHRCDNPPCFRPSHLFLGSHADNVADMVRKGRQPRTRVARLTDNQVAEIRRLRASGFKTTVIGEIFGVHSSHVGRICRGVYHAASFHVTDGGESA